MKDTRKLLDRLIFHWIGNEGHSKAMCTEVPASFR